MSVFRLVDCTKLKHVKIKNEVDLVRFINVGTFNLTSLRWGNIVVNNVIELFNYIPYSLDKIDNSITIDVCSLNPFLEKGLAKFTVSSGGLTIINLPTTNRKVN